jgi:glycosyltransferase involved in cell wall biosynthesis
MQRFIAEHGLEPHVEVLVNPTDDAVREAYRTAQVLLFPSVYEGFGWPPLEAMAWGCPVVCSIAGSLEEIVGPAALVGHHEDEAGLAELVCRVLNDDALAADLADRGRAWVERYQLSGLHDRVARVYRELAETPA